MLRIDRQGKAFKSLDSRRIHQAGLKERYDLQQMIRNNADVFFSEMGFAAPGQRLLLIGEEVRPTKFVEDRIDLLAIDQQGATVVIEIKRGGHKLQLLQSLAYASMVAKWERDQLTSERATLTNKPTSDVEEEIEEFLLEDIAELNKSQRIILLAEDYDYEVLATAEWLTEKYDVDIRCFRLTLSADGDAEFLSCTCIYPAPELADHANRRRQPPDLSESKWANWDAALDAIDNQALVEFYRRELSANQENYLRKRTLYYRISGKRRFSVAARRDSAYVWQHGRFKDDVGFWTNRIDSHADVEPVKQDTRLRFYLTSEADFARFLEAVRGDLQTVDFSDADEALDADSE
jgi:hypothetical protein